MSDNLRSILLMLVSMAAFTFNDAAVKLSFDTIHVSQAIFVRGVMASVILYFLWRFYAPPSYRPSRRDVRDISLRTFGEIAATLTYLFALQQMPLANVMAILQSTPIVVTLAAAVFFGERIGLHRICAILVGFIGVMIVIRPGPEGFDIWAFVALISVFFVVFRDLVTRGMNPAIPSSLVAFVTAVLVMVTGLIGTLIEGWQPMVLRDLVILTVACVFIIIAYITAVAAMRQGDVGAVAPFRYTQLLWAALCGWLVFNEWPDPWTWFGSGLIVVSGIYTILRGARRQEVRA